MTDKTWVLKGGQLIDGNGGDPIADGDPLADIKVLQGITKITHVYKDGAPVPRMPAGS